MDLQLTKNRYNPLQYNTPNTINSLSHDPIDLKFARMKISNSDNLHDPYVTSDNSNRYNPQYNPETRTYNLRHRHYNSNPYFKQPVRISIDPRVYQKLPQDEYNQSIAFDEFNVLRTNISKSYDLNNPPRHRYYKEENIGPTKSLKTETSLIKKIYDSLVEYRMKLVRKLADESDDNWKYVPEKLQKKIYKEPVKASSSSSESSEEEGDFYKNMTPGDNIYDPIYNDSSLSNSEKRKIRRTINYVLEKYQIPQHKWNEYIRVWMINYNKLKSNEPLFDYTREDTLISETQIFMDMYDDQSLIGPLSLHEKLREDFARLTVEHKVDSQNIIQLTQELQELVTITEVEGITQKLQLFFYEMLRENKIPGHITTKKGKLGKFVLDKPTGKIKFKPY